MVTLLIRVYDSDVQMVCIPVATLNVFIKATNNFFRTIGICPECGCEWSDDTEEINHTETCQLVSAGYDTHEAMKHLE